jgi:hypothetical protein
MIPTPKRDNVHFIARLQGATASSPLLLLGHSDVVSVERDRWSIDPYGGVVKDGWLLMHHDGTTPMMATLTYQDKINALVEVTAQGTTTHSSKPLPDAAIVRLNRLLFAPSRRRARALRGRHQRAVWRQRGVPVIASIRTGSTTRLTACTENDERVRVVALQRGAQLMYELFGQFRSR